MQRQVTGAPQYHGTVRAVTHLELGQGPSKPAQLPHTWSSPGGGDSQAEPAQELEGDDIGDGWHGRTCPLLGIP